LDEVLFLVEMSETKWNLVFQDLITVYKLVDQVNKIGLAKS